MSSRVLRRRSATAAWIYAAVACGIAGSIVAARVFGLDDFGVFMTALVVVGFFQSLLDLTVEESLTKYGFRYVTGEDWGRLRRLFRQALLLKVVGGVLATLLVVALAPFADEIFDADGLEQALLAAALLPLVQSSENVGATALLLHSRYDLRSVYQAGSAALRLVAIVIAAPLGVTEALVAIVVAQTISTVVISFVGAVALRRFPAGAGEGARRGRAGDPHVRPAVERRDRRHLAAHDADPVDPRRRLGHDAGRSLPHRDDTADRPRGGELARAPRPAHGADPRLGEGRALECAGRGAQLLEVGGRDHGRGGAGVLRGHAVAHPDRLRLGVRRRRPRGAESILIAAAIHFALGWTKSLPVTIGRPRLRIVTHGLETIVAIPLVALLGDEWGATGAAVGVLVSTVVFALAWLVVIVRLRDEVHASEGAGGAAFQP